MQIEGLRDVVDLVIQIEHLVTQIIGIALVLHRFTIAEDVN